jgi:hypothetical protein
MKYLLSIPFLLLLSGSNVPSIKKNIDELFFRIPINATKFEARSILNGDKNFYKFHDYDDILGAISARFHTNFKLSYMPEDATIVLWYDKGEEKTYMRKLAFEYKLGELQKCKSQYEELITMFKDISFKVMDSKITSIYTNEQIGVGKKFYSSQHGAPYLEVFYRMTDLSNYRKLYPEQKVVDYYIFEIEFHDKELK